MIKSFEELYKLEVPTKKFNGFDYLNWLDCLLLLRENGAATVAYDEDRTESVTYPSEGRTYISVKAWVEIDSVRRTITYPVASGEIPICNATCLDIEFAKQRAFVKCVAINWGLGLKLWEKGVDVAADDSGLKEEVVKICGALIGPKFTSHEDLMEFIFNIDGVGEKISEMKGKDNSLKFGRFLETGTTEDKRKVLSKLEAL